MPTINSYGGKVSMSFEKMFWGAFFWNDKR